MVRFAEKADLDRVNELRKQVNEIHAAGRPDIFKPGFGRELQDLVYAMWSDDNKNVIVAERNGVICGYACVVYVGRPEGRYTCQRKFYHIDEFGVDEKARRQGIATEMFTFIRKDAREKDFLKIELDMWEFNEGALKFYEAIGFRTYRRYMECGIEEEL
ncbi:MAG: GNAT family N-acetyltransferase [Clostridiales bacterium]|nr:GNAT family N-acetyltransferase [Clostridiales bacterium]